MKLVTSLPLTCSARLERRLLALLAFQPLEVKRVLRTQHETLEDSPSNSTQKRATGIGFITIHLFSSSATQQISRSSSTLRREILRQT